MTHRLLSFWALNITAKYNWIWTISCTTFLEIILYHGFYNNNNILYIYTENTFKLKSTDYD